jgi:hypothetical protein
LPILPFCRFYSAEQNRKKVAVRYGDGGRACVSRAIGATWGNRQKPKLRALPGWWFVPWSGMIEGAMPRGAGIGPGRRASVLENLILLGDNYDQV